MTRKASHEGATTFYFIFFPPPANIVKVGCTSMPVRQRFYLLFRKAKKKLPELDFTNYYFGQLQHDRAFFVEQRCRHAFRSELLPGMKE
jgi:hypothetical protein